MKNEAKIFTRKGLLEIAREGDLTKNEARVHHAHSLHPGKVMLPHMPIGATFLDRWAVREEPGGVSWRRDYYECMAPATFVLRDAMVHSSAGIITLGEDVVMETLGHTTGEEHNYHSTKEGIVVEASQVRHLSGTHITVLAGAKRNYFHSIMESLARISMVPPHLLEAAASVLHPKGGAAQSDILNLLGLPERIGRRAVDDDETFQVDTLVFPWTVHGMASYHPCVSKFFDVISDNVPKAGDFPKRVYLDRRGSLQRRLTNEDEVVAKLQPLGFVAIRPETLEFADQVRLFRGAEAIVAPHGAALTNLGFCHPGCCVLELHMDAYVNWFFRHLAALRALDYDCVIGRSLAPWPELLAASQALVWRISSDHVAAAAHHLLNR